MLEADSHAKVQMRRKVCGLRKIEQAVLKRQSAEALTSLAEDDPAATVTVIVAPANWPSPEPDSAGTVVLDYVRLYVEFSITTREALSILPACSWPRL